MTDKQLPPTTGRGCGPPPRPDRETTATDTIDYRRVLGHLSVGTPWNAPAWTTIRDDLGYAAVLLETATLGTPGQYRLTLSPDALYALQHAPELIDIAGPIDGLDALRSLLGAYFGTGRLELLIGLDPPDLVTCEKIVDGWRSVRVVYHGVLASTCDTCGLDRGDEACRETPCPDLNRDGGHDDNT